MAETVRAVDYFYMMVPDKPGEGARILGTLRNAGVNLRAYSGFPSGRGAQLDFVPADPAAFQAVARDRKSTRLNSSHGYISYAVFCLKKKKKSTTYASTLE